jgi:predicted AlkP superfamily pyrophosphatase or phosphodiesterase
MGIDPPAECSDTPLNTIIDHIAQINKPVSKFLVFAADAIGMQMNLQHLEDFSDVEVCAPIVIPLRAVMPTVTPVNYASMFSGTTPTIHGIQTYAKPVLSIETIFDALSAAGKNVAIVAVADSSIDRIFRNRPIDYFSEIDDQHVVNQATNIMKTDYYDFIVVYNAEYDDTLHRTTPYSSESIAAMRAVIRRFLDLASIFDSGEWEKHNRALLFAPDHGAHIDQNGRGTHGADIPEDVIVQHYLGIRSSCTT